MAGEDLAINIQVNITTVYVHNMALVYFAETEILQQKKKKKLMWRTPKSLEILIPYRYSFIMGKQF